MANIGYIPPLCVDSYSGIEEWKILNESRNGYAIADFNPENRRFIWLNNAALTYMFRRSLQQMQTFDMKAQSKAIQDRWDAVYQEVQIGGATNRDVKTVYFGDKPTTMNVWAQPIRGIPPGETEERRLTLVEYTPALSEEEKIDNAHKAWRLSDEFLRHVEVMVISFEMQTSEHVVTYQNNKSRIFYGDIFREGCPGLRRWFDTLLTEGEGENMCASVLLDRVMAMKVGDPVIEFDCQKRCGSALARLSLRGSSEASCEAPGSEEWSFVRVRVSAIYDPNTAQQIVLVQEADVTALKNTQRSLIEAQKAQESFFLSISHELRTPLHGVIGLSSSLLKDPTLSAQLHKTLCVIQTSGKRMLHIVNDILDAGSCKYSELVVKQEEVNLAAVAEDVCQVLAVLVRKGVALQNRIRPGDCPLVRGDTARVHQILTNLISNAIKFTPKGSISVLAAPDPESPGMVLVQIVDTGVGIPPERVGEVWGAFKQVDRETTQKFGGTGLGLPLVKSLVAAHGGSVGTASQPGEGSTFSFTLPTAHGAAGGQWGSGDAQEARGRSDAGSPGAGEAVEVGELREKLEAERRRAGELERRAGELKERAEAAERGLAEAEARLKRLNAQLEARGRGGAGGGRWAPASDAGGEGQGDAVQAGGEEGGEGEGAGAEGGWSGQEAWAENWGQRAEGGARGAWVLSVDGDSVNQLVIRNLLEPRGFRVSTCHNGLQALRRLGLPLPGSEDDGGVEEVEEEEEEEGGEGQHAGRGLPQLVLLDNMMPGLTGVEVAARIRARYSPTRLPIIILSAREDQRSMEEALRAGCSDFLRKPLPRSELLARVGLQFALREAWGGVVARAGEAGRRRGAAEGGEGERGGGGGEEGRGQRGSVWSRGEEGGGSRGGQGSDAGGDAGAGAGGCGDGAESAASGAEGATRGARRASRGASCAARSVARSSAAGDGGRGEAGGGSAGRWPGEGGARAGLVAARFEAEALRAEVEKGRWERELEVAEREDLGTLMEVQLRVLQGKLQRRDDALARAEAELAAAKQRQRVAAGSGLPPQASERSPAGQWCGDARERLPGARR